jgi:hypothetical protein
LQIISYIKQLRHFVSGTRDKQPFGSNRRLQKSRSDFCNTADVTKSTDMFQNVTKRVNFRGLVPALPLGQRIFAPPFQIRGADKDKKDSKLNSKGSVVSQATAAQYGRRILGESGPSVMQQRLAVISQKLDNGKAIKEEYSKIKFLEYLKDIVKKYRQENIYFYLSTIAESKKELRNIQKYTKKHSNLFFVFHPKGEKKNPVDTPQEPGLIKRVQKTLLDPASHASVEVDTAKATLAQFQLRDIEKFRRIYQQNCELTPKISIQFYSAPADIIETKATMVVDSIVDALEKRQAFRKIIKKALSTAMKNVRVKGIKIQLAGRLNGAEIARTE